MYDAVVHLISSTLALILLLIFLFGPIGFVWLAFSIRRDIRRIADALDSHVQRLTPQETVELDVDERGKAVVTGRVAHSMFAR